MGRSLKNERRGGNSQKTAPNPNPQVNKGGKGGMHPMPGTGGKMRGAAKRG